ncbi:RHS domain-containing protein [Photobacterium damselae]|nr:RHS domain-containing protein [Photobacterium damselae]
MQQQQGHTVRSCDYQYNATGNLAEVRDNRYGVTQYKYDSLDRLKAAKGAVDEEFAHDLAGNLLEQTLGRLAGRTHTSISSNQLLFQGDAHFEYDEFGRLITERRGKNQTLVTHYEYDCQHRLIRATMPDGSQACYVYDAFGRRISKTVTDKLGQSSTTEFVWQGDKLLVEQTDGQNYQTYLYQPDSFKPLALLKGEGKACEIYHNHLDHLGTPTDLTDEQGNIVWQAQYRSYGDVVAQHVEKIVNPIRFQGQYYDSETGLHYNRHRYYSPKTGRFTTVDPIGLAGGLNNYQYVPNPVNWVDPLGLMSVDGNGCVKKWKRFDKYHESRREAFRQAKKDAGIPMSSQANKVKNVDLTDANGNPILDSSYNVISTREYHFESIYNEKVVIQEHSLGHSDYPNSASSRPHFNVREYDMETDSGHRNRTLSRENVALHYVFIK